MGYLDQTLPYKVQCLLIIYFATFVQPCPTLKASPSEFIANCCDCGLESRYVSDGFSHLTQTHIWYGKTGSNSQNFANFVQVSSSSGPPWTQILGGFPVANLLLAGSVSLPWPKTLTEIKVWAKIYVDYKMSRMVTQWQFLFNDGTSQIIAPPTNLHSVDDTLFIFKIPTNAEFIGFQNKLCHYGDIFLMQVYYRYNTCPDWVDAFIVTLSSFNGQSVQIGSNTFSINFSVNQPATYCGMNCNLSINAYMITVTGPNPGLITLSNSTSPTITFGASTELADAGIYGIAVKVSANGGNTWSVPTNAVFTYVNPYCNQASVSITSVCPSTQYVNLNGQLTTQIAWTFSNTTQNYVCGQSSIAYVTQAPNQAANNTMYAKFTTSVSGANSIITTAPTLDSELGIYNLIVRQCLVDAVNLSKCAICNVPVQVCQVSNIAITQQNNGPLVSKQWTISRTDSFTYQLVAQTSPACNYQSTQWTDWVVTATRANNPSSVSLDYTISSQGLFKVENIKDSMAAGDYTVTVTSIKLNGVAYSGTIFTNATFPNSFQLKVIDPCPFSQISGPDSLQNFFQFAGLIQYSTKTYTFNDTVSQRMTLPFSSQDFCGEKLFNFQVNQIDITSQTAQLLVGSNTQAIAFQPPITATTASTLPAALIVSMKNYPQIQNKIVNFTVTTIKVKVPFMTTQNYQIGQYMAKFPCEVFQLLPLETIFDLPLTNKTTAYLQTNGSTLAYPLDLQSSSLTQILPSGWINFDPSKLEFTIFTLENKYAGIWTVVVVLSFDSYPGLYFNTSFYVIIAPRIVSQAPYFSPELPASYAVKQCPWSLKLPQTADPKDLPVIISVVLDQKYLIFDAVSNTISQNAIADKPITQIVQIQLTNSEKKTTSIQLRLEFNCSSSSGSSSNANLSQQQSYQGSSQFANKSYLDAEYSSINSQTKTSNDQKTQTQTKPTASIKQIDRYGQMTVQFSQKMTVPSNITQLLQNGSPQIDGTTLPNLIIKTVPGKLSNYTVVNLQNWTVQSFSSTQLIVQLNFQNPSLISQHSTYPDQICLIFKNVSLFTDIFGSQLQQNTEIQKNLPPMAPRKAIEQALKLGRQASNTLTGALVANFIIVLLTAGPLSQIFSSIKTLQIILSQMLINLTYPVVANVYLGMLMGVMTFQIIDFTPQYNTIFQLEDTGNDPLTYQFGVMGYNSKYIIQNFGTLCLTVFYTPLVYLFLKLLVWGGWGTWIDSLDESVKKAKNNMCYNSWIQLINETFLFMGTCGAVNLFYLYFNSYGNVINSLISLVVCVIILAFPIQLLCLYLPKSNYDKILEGDEEFLARYGSVLEDLNFKRMGKKVLIFVIFGFVRKLILIYITVFMQKYRHMSIMSTMILTQAMIMVIGEYPPYKSISQNNMEIINELFVLFTNYHLFLLTDFLTNVNRRENVGTSLVITICACILLNILVVVVSNGTIILRKLKLKYIMMNQESIRAQQLQERKMNVLNQKANLLEQKEKVSQQSNAQMSVADQERLEKKRNKIERKLQTLQNKLDKIMKQQYELKEKKMRKKLAEQRRKQLREATRQQKQREQYKRKDEIQQNQIVQKAFSKQRLDYKTYKNLAHPGNRDQDKTLNSKGRVPVEATSSRQNLNKNQYRNKISGSAVKSFNLHSLTTGNVSVLSQLIFDEQPPQQEVFSQFQEIEIPALNSNSIDYLVQPGFQNQLVIDEEQNYKGTGSELQNSLYQRQNQHVQNNRNEYKQSAFNKQQQKQGIKYVDAKAKQPFASFFSQKISNQQDFKLSTYQEMVIDMSMGQFSDQVLVDLAFYFDQLQKKAPTKWSEVQSELANICKKQDFYLWKTADLWFKTHGKDGQFAMEHNIDIQTAVDFRNGKLDNIMQEFRQGMIDQQAYALQGSELSEYNKRRLKYYFQLDAFHPGMIDQQRVQHYKALLNGEETGGLFREILDL